MSDLRPLDLPTPANTGDPAPQLIGKAPGTRAAGTPGADLTLELERERFHISEEFLARYNRPGPRYTSYPTAPVWQDNFGPADLEEVYAQAAAFETPVSLYMHLPFCESLCLFCACNVIITKDHSAAPPYLATLKREIAHVAENVAGSRPVVQFHWGGGTPTYLTPAQMEDLFGFAAEKFTFAPDAEIGIEVDPRVTSVRHLESLRRLGFNRLSLGIQDFDPEVQQAIHRVQPLEMTRRTHRQARALGFRSLNVDLIYGLPYQTAQRFGQTVEEVLTLAPDRVAMFSYAHVPWLRKQQGALGSASAGGHGEISHFPYRPRVLFGCRIPIYRHGPFRANPTTSWRWRSATARCIAIFRVTPPKGARTFTVWESARSAASGTRTRKIIAK